MSGRMAVAQGFPLTLSSSKGERKAFFNGPLALIWLWASKHGRS